MINSAILASHKEKSIYSSAYDCLLECYVVDGRRKILRLYWAVAIIKYWWKLPYHYALTAKVETQNLASHKGKSIYSSAYNCLLDCYGVDGRRKILRLY